MLDRLRRNSFLVIGRAGMDLYADPPGTEIESADYFSAALGGSAANIAVAISRQGGKVSLLTTVSDDAVGRFTRRALSSYGVDTQHVGSVGGEARNSLAVVETRVANIQSIIYRNNAADFLVTDADVKAVDYEGFGAVIITGTCLAREPSRSATLTAMRRARAAGATVVIDIDYRPYSWTSTSEAAKICMEAVTLSDIIVANDEEFAVLADRGDGLQLAQSIADTGAQIAIYKMGEKGCRTFHDESHFDTPVFKVTALKPTGAGDAFMGGLMAGLAAGLPLQDAVERGAATAALVVTRVGCAPAMPHTNDVDTFMQLAKA
jgi:5-dehydro-2-deoxygluconokinase